MTLLQLVPYSPKPGLWKLIDFSLFVGVFLNLG